MGALSNAAICPSVLLSDCLSLCLFIPVAQKRYILELCYYGTQIGSPMLEVENIS